MRINADSSQVAVFSIVFKIPMPKELFESSEFSLAFISNIFNLFPYCVCLQMILLKKKNLKR